MKSKKLIKTVLLDILGYAIGMGIFLLFFYLIPYELEADNTVVGNTDVVNAMAFKFTSDMDFVMEDHRNSSSNTSKNHNKHNNHDVDYDHLGTTDLQTDDNEVSNILNADITSEIVHEYEDDNIIITVYKKELYEDSDKITYYVGDIQVRSLSYLKTALAKDKYGVNIKDDSLSIADDNNALLAITGDNYSNNENGIVVRNGILYRDKSNDADVCVLFVDGTMKTYTSEEFNTEEILAEGVWQAWCFGPSLLDDGNILSTFVSTPYLSEAHPRVAIGYIQPGHYIFTVVDGREKGYSRGVTLSELSTLMHLENCNTAFNLDGGGSASMIFDGEFVNHSTDRDVSDIIYIAP